MIELKSQRAIMPKEEDPVGRPIIGRIPTSAEIGKQKPIIEQIHETLETRRTVIFDHSYKKAELQ